jgi:acylaminoacyl-peptidase
VRLCTYWCLGYYRSASSHHFIVRSSSPLTAAIRSVRDIDNNKRRRYLYSIPLPDPKYPDRSFPSIPPTELHESVKVRLPSPSGSKIAIFHQEAAVDSPQVLEVWTNGGQALLRRIVLPAKSHGKVISDVGGFGRPTWNADETVLVYTAERNVPETVSFFAGADSKDDGSKIRGGTNTLGLGKTENWGEKYGKQAATFDLFCVNVETGNVGLVENVPGQEDAKTSTIGGYTLGQPVFSPNGSSLVYTAWDAGGGPSMPRRLGLIYCQQRPSQLYWSSISRLLERLASSTSNGSGATDVALEKDKAFVNLTPQNCLSRSPAFSPVGENGTCKLVFLASQKGFDTHQGCLALYSFDWAGDAEIPTADGTTVLVDQVWDPRESLLDIGEFDGLRFPGLFLQQLPETCFPSAEHLVTTTQWGSRQKVVQVSLKDGSTSAVDFGEDFFSEELLCVAPNGSLVVSKKSPNVPNAVYYIPKSSATGEPQVGMRLPGLSPISSTSFSVVPLTASSDFKCSIEILSDPPKVDGVDFDLPVQSVLLLPDREKYPNPPVIVVPHGGPHSCSTAAYLPSYAYLCSHGGYALLMVNYRGSTGFGQASIEALPTNIGELDVKDVIAATLQLKESGLVDPDRIGICGGSHGGFLTGHCTGQYPDLFKAAAMRNPVVNIPSMVSATDICDWCYVEACGKYNWGEFRPPSQDELRIMWEKSPVRYAENVKTPTLVALGLSDLRVPPSQGKEWYHTLRAKGVPSKLLVYGDDDHAIAGVVSEADHWVNIKRWFDEHL